MIILPELIEKQSGNYIRSKPDALTNLEIIQQIDSYKHNISQRLASLHPKILQDFRDHTSKWDIGKELHVSIKVDGEGMFLIYNRNANNNESKSYFCNATKHRILIGLKVNEEIEDILEQVGVESAIIAGELFAAPIDSSQNQPNFDARAHVYDLTHCMRNPENQLDLDRIGFRIFDLIELNNKKWLEKLFRFRFEKLKEIFPEYGRVALVRNQILDGNNLFEYFNQVVEIGGAEGIVVKNSENFRGFKIKPVRMVDAVIIGALAGREDSKIQSNELSVALIALRYPDGTYQLLGRVGGGLSDKQRKDLWSKMVFVESEYIGVAHDGRGFRMVQPQYVAQIEYLDIYTLDRDNQPNMKPSLIFDEENKKWKSVRSMPFVNLISPRFCSENPIREDKENNIFDVRVDQISEYVDLTTVKSVQQLELPQSEILERRVFFNKEKVKKFLVWKTNKREITPIFPNFVISFTDYSPKRQTKLVRKLKVTNDEQQSLDILETWIESEMMSSDNQNLKRGWQIYETISRDSQKKEKFIRVLKTISKELAKLSSEVHLVFPSPTHSELDHIILSLQAGNIEDFANILSNYDETEWIDIKGGFKGKLHEKLIMILKKLKVYSQAETQEKIKRLFE